MSLVCALASSCDPLINFSWFRSMYFLNAIFTLFDRVGLTKLVLFLPVIKCLHSRLSSIDLTDICPDISPRYEWSALMSVCTTCFHQIAKRGFYSKSLLFGMPYLNEQICGVGFFPCTLLIPLTSKPETLDTLSKAKHERREIPVFCIVVSAPILILKFKLTFRLARQVIEFLSIMVHVLWQHEHLFYKTSV